VRAASLAKTQSCHVVAAVAQIQIGRDCREFTRRKQEPRIWDTARWRNYHHKCLSTIDYRNSCISVKNVCGLTSHNGEVMQRRNLSDRFSPHWAVVRSGQESNPQPLDYETDELTTTPLIEIILVLTYPCTSRYCLHSLARSSISPSKSSHVSSRASSHRRLLSPRSVSSRTPPATWWAAHSRCLRRRHRAGGSWSRQAGPGSLAPP